MINKTCPICGNAFIVRYPSQDKNYCSRECMFKDPKIRSHYWKGKKRKPETNLKISKTLKKKGISPKERFCERGNKHPSWKGGRNIHSNGYVFVKVDNHPYADERGYVYEHRLVMEKHLGRFLKPEEVVHHVNGIKTDNQFKNLKLFKSHAEHRLEHSKIERLKSEGAVFTNA